MFDHKQDPQHSSALRRRLNDYRLALQPWGRSIINYREELRRAVGNIEERRLVRMRSY
ncbi:hypothetical protein [Ramlibacter sp.]|uniref:hypothetical protein n=1 Tax=Ramlibacter sp. TaxID=1917967 RepID=UPI003D0E4641